MTQPKEQEQIVSKLLKDLAVEERAKLIAKLNVSRSTFYRYQRLPGEVPVSHAVTIRDYLGAAYGIHYTLEELFKRNRRKAKSVAA